MAFIRIAATLTPDGKTQITLCSIPIEVYERSGGGITRFSIVVCAQPHVLPLALVSSRVQDAGQSWQYWCQVFLDRSTSDTYDLYIKWSIYCSESQKPAPETQPRLREAEQNPQARTQVTDSIQDPIIQSMVVQLAQAPGRDHLG